MKKYSRTPEQRRIHNSIQWGQALWLIGTVLITLGWFRVVGPLIAWLGFLMSLVGVLLSTFARRRLSKRHLTAKFSTTIQPVKVEFTDTQLQVTLTDGRVISAPLDWYPKLANASDEERAMFDLDQNGIFWPDLEVDVSVLDMLDGYAPSP